MVSVGEFACNKCEISGSKPFVVSVTPPLPEGLDLDQATGPLPACLSFLVCL